MAAFIDLTQAPVDRVVHGYVRRRVLATIRARRSNVVIGPDVVSTENVNIGAGTVLNDDCYINAQGGVSIGRHRHIARGLTILSSNHNFRSSLAIPCDNRHLLAPVVICDAVWIGANISIHPGSTIRDGAILAPGAVVRATVESCAIVAGNPGRVVALRERELFLELQKREAFN